MTSYKNFSSIVQQTDVVQRVVDDLVIIKDQEGFVYWPEFALNNIYSLTIGQGYQIKMTNETGVIP